MASTGFGSKVGRTDHLYESDPRSMGETNKIIYNF